VLCEKQGKINDAYKKLYDGWLDSGDKMPPAEFAKVSIQFMGTCLYIQLETNHVLMFAFN
jgi:hypothetical protein